MLFCYEVFLELRFWIFVRNFFLSSYLKENLLMVLTIRFFILTILGCLENFSTHTKTGLSWEVLERCVLSLCILKFLIIDLKKFWKVFAASISVELISLFLTSVIFSFDLILFEKRAEIFFINILLTLTNFTSSLSNWGLFHFFRMLAHLFLCWLYATLVVSGRCLR